MILLIDNYDSFTWNLWHFLADLGGAVETRRNDALTAAEAIALKPQAIVLSPGPCTPHEAGICTELVHAAAAEAIPLFGVCLGFQSIGVALGASLTTIDPPVHGKFSIITHSGKGVMAGCPDRIPVVRYHSLALDRETLPDCLEVTAETEAGLVMGIAHKTAAIHGVLFHPESIATVAGYRMLANFMRLAGMNSVEDSRLAELESRTLNLHERFPDHIHA